MQNIHEDSKPVRLIYFWIGIIATFGYRIIIVLNFFEPTWVKIAWYVGTIGFIVYFWSRFKVVKQFSSLIEKQQLVKAVEKAENISDDQRQALSHVIKTLETTRAQTNYVVIFILSALALIAAILLDIYM